MKTSGVFVLKFELNPFWRLILVWYKLYLTHKKYHSKPVDMTAISNNGNFRVQ